MKINNEVSIFNRLEAVDKTIRVYHRTYASEAILKEGFRDTEGTYMTGHFFRGVWVSNYPLDSDEGARGDVVLSLDIPTSIFEYYEWVEDEKPYRESLIPAEILNKYKINICTEEEIDAAAPYLK